MINNELTVNNVRCIVDVPIGRCRQDERVIWRIATDQRRVYRIIKRGVDLENAK